MKKRLFNILAFILFLAVSVAAQDTNSNTTLTGSWLGKLNTGAFSLRVVFNISVVKTDSLVATMDSPDQGAKGIKLGAVNVTGRTIKILAPILLGEYNGTIKNDTLIEGTWTQRGNSMALNLSRLKTAFTISRPQEPKQPYPYTSEDITFHNDKFNITLAGTLTIPSGKGPFPAVILITGSGPQNRNEELMGHKPFLVIADYLTRNGIAVLRYDDRGVGKSQGTYSSATSLDLASDADAAFKWLQSQSNIDTRKIGLIGHSEGGLIAPIVASTNGNIAFIVSLAGPGITGENIILKQAADIGKASGVPEKDTKESVEINRKLYAVVKKEKDNNKAEAKVLDVYREILRKKKTSEDDSGKAIKQLKASFGANTYTWFRYFIMTDPSVYWKKVKCPVLALNGDKDLQVTAVENLQGIEKALKSGGNKNVTTEKLEGLNHLFQHCNTGLPSEYSSIEETFSPEGLEIIRNWILAL